MSDRPMAKVTDAEIEHRFGYHRATFPAGFNPSHDKLLDWADVPTKEGPPATAPQHAQARVAFIEMAQKVRDMVPSDQGRYAALALTALEEAMHWTNAGIAMASPLVDER